MGWKGRPGEGRSRKLERFKAHLAWKHEISSALDDIRSAHRLAVRTTDDQAFSTRRPLQLQPRSAPTPTLSPHPRPAGPTPLSDEEIRGIIAQDHHGLLVTKPTSLVDRCLHVMARHLDQYPTSDTFVVEAMQAGLSPDLHHRLSILSTWYHTMTADNVALLCTPATQALCLGQLNVDAVVVPLVAPDAYTSSPSLDSWEDLPDIVMHWSGCPYLTELELVQCYEISIALLQYVHSP
ncbi:hypothetical protein AaE_013000 [Aphanomyces astaci]|uniref:Uncharacterized protein n=1 Tax=Aphanomyces astaci TaxID=112090 RepID=A0A6A4ZEL3_APHAT|nr:hypothetical protein AaE_013000 [Aphanomyces astaci]